MDERVTRLFGKTNFMKTLNAQLTEARQGFVKIECNFSEKLTQHHGYLHAGVMTSLVDNACGLAAFTMMPENAEVLTVEFKVNFLKPAKTDKLIAVGKVLQSGKTLTICEGYVYDSTEDKLIAKMQASMIAIEQ